MTVINKNVFKTMEIFDDMKYGDVRREVMNGNLSVDTIVKISSKYHNLLHEISDELINYDNGLQRKSEHDYEITILYLAFYFDDEEFFDYLIKNNADVSMTTKNFGHIMTYAIKFKKLKYVVKLIDSGMEADQSLHVLEIEETYPSFTLLQQAVLCNSCEIFEFLVSRGASIDINNFEYPRPVLNMAAYNGSADVMELLLDKYGCEINKINFFDVAFETALESALRKESNEKTIKILLNHPTIEINQTNSIDQTYLHVIMALPMSESYAKLVLDAGCDVNLMDKNEKLVIDYTYKDFCLPEYYDIFDRYFHSSMLIVKHHIIKLIAAGFHVCDRNVEAVNAREFNDIRKKCWKEIKSMKKTKDNVTGLTYYDILRKPQHKLALGLKRFDNDVTFDEETVESNFPLYGGMINYRLAKIVQRKKILDGIQNVIYNVFYKVFSTI